MKKCKDIWEIIKVNFSTASKNPRNAYSAKITKDMRNEFLTVMSINIIFSKICHSLVVSISTLEKSDTCSWNFEDTGSKFLQNIYTCPPYYNTSCTGRSLSRQPVLCRNISCPLTKKYHHQEPSNLGYNLLHQYTNK